MNTIQPITEGQVINTDFGQYTAQPACENKGGQWYCVTHSKSFRNQFDKDTHVHKGEHQLAWICLQHGIEVP